MLLFSLAWLLIKKFKESGCVMKTGWVIFIAVVVFIVSVGGTFLVLSPEAKSVEVNLVNAIGDQLPYYEFMVNKKEIPSGQTIKFFNDSFVIEVFKVDKDEKTSIDKFDIGSLIERGDKVTYAYYGEASTRGKALCICIYRENTLIREISVNID